MSLECPGGAQKKEKRLMHFRWTGEKGRHWSNQFSADSGLRRREALIPHRIGRQTFSQKPRIIDILHVIAGDGGMKAAHALWHLANRTRPPDRQLVVVTVPKTMDNDI